MLDFEQLWDGWPSRSFLKSMRVRTKHAKKSRVGLWGQSLILEVTKAYYRGLKKGYLWKVLTNKDVEWNVIVWSPIEWAIETSIIRDITNGIRVNLSPSTGGSRTNQAKPGGHVTPQTNHTQMRGIQGCASVGLYSWWWLKRINWNYLYRQDGSNFW